jgi:hypothetical protein
MNLILNQIGESTVDFRQLAKFPMVYWRKFSGISPLVKVLLAKILLAKVGIPINSEAI